MSVDLLAAEAVLEFGEELRNAQEAAGEWTDEVLGQGYRPRHRHLRSVSDLGV